MTTTNTAKPPATARSYTPAEETTERLYAIIRKGVDRGALAGLIRSWQQPDAIHPQVLKVTRTAPDQDLASHEAVAGLFGLWHVAWNESEPRHGKDSFGSFMNRVSWVSKGNPGIETLFQVILTLPRTDAVRQIGVALQRGRSEGVLSPPKWESLIEDLAGWDNYHHTVQKKWANDFWRPQTT